MSRSLASVSRPSRSPLMTVVPRMLSVPALEIVSRTTPHASPRLRAGEVSVGGDCCDQDPKVYPGQTAYATGPSACGSYDYNCSGRQELQHPSCAIPAGTMTAPA